jgi:hypothetical protein
MIAMTPDVLGLIAAVVVALCCVAVLTPPRGKR